ncbi:MAG TPA: mechanosensitive ion channel, partial [Spirochaetota bacterium]|nr:mechanosensitive ion channel [Spirochaetota bacterium]
LTNIGTFRAYAKLYIERHPKFNKNLTYLVRQLQTTGEGLPLEIYFFSSDTGWVNYEDVQSDIFDHLYSILPYFELRAFQKPGGFDIRSIGERKR